MATARARRALIAGLLLAALSLGLPWGLGTGGFFTYSYYVPSYCDGYVCYGGYFVPGSPVAAITTVHGISSTARFFIVAAAALALIGWRLGVSRLMRAAALVAAAGIAWHFTAGLTGGAVALGLAAFCFWLAARDLADREVSPSAG